MNRCVRRKIAWQIRTGEVQDCKGEQYLELPRAICDPHGNPHKGQKSYTTKWLERRYKDITISKLVAGWVANAVVLEGMFLINTTPLGTHTSMLDYATFLLRRFVMPHLASGTQEVHIVFDNPGRQPHSPKAFERKRRDATNALPSDHKHAQFDDSLGVPTKWREHLSCRICKRQLVEYLGKAFLKHAPSLLRSNQKLVLAGCFQGDAEDQAWEITREAKQPNPLLNCTAEEADTRVWLHTLRSPGSKKLLYSPDTDVYHIGLPLLQKYPSDVFIQLSPVSSPERKLLHLNSLCDSLSADPDLAVIPSEVCPKFLQTLFICTGCD